MGAKDTLARPERSGVLRKAHRAGSVCKRGIRARALGFAGTALLAVLCAGIAASTAGAYDNMYKTANYGPDCHDGSIYETFCQTDNATLTWFEQSSVTDTGQTNIRSVLEGPFEDTVLSISRDGTPSYSGGAETDIIYQQGSLQSPFIGYTWCNDAVSDTRCDQHYVRFLHATPSTKLACHESGHAVGLTHGQDAAPRTGNGDDTLHCMQTPIDEVTSATLGDHQKSEITNTYN
jgi:hypothetical protein